MKDFVIEAWTTGQCLRTLMHDLVVGLSVLAAILVCAVIVATVQRVIERW